MNAIVLVRSYSYTDPHALDQLQRYHQKHCYQKVVSSLTTLLQSESAFSRSRVYTISKSSQAKSSRYDNTITTDRSLGGILLRPSVNQSSPCHARYMSSCL